MLRRPATRIELKMEDIEDFEKIREEKTAKKMEVEDRSKLTVEQRIGINTAQKRSRNGH